jgi:hypothetical protein
MISFDVGIKHLAYCIFQKDTDKVVKWGVIDLSTSSTKTEHQEEDNVQKCLFCKTKAFVANNDVMYCKRHLKEKVENPMILSNDDFDKLTVKELLQIQQRIVEKMPDLLLQQPKKPKKEGLLTFVSKYISQVCCVPVNIKKKKTNVSNISLIILGKNMKCELDKLHLGDLDLELDTVIIENQVGPIASRMKTIQGMLAQYFIMKFPSLLKIECVSSQNKLKNTFEEEEEQKEDTTSTTYKGRKQMSVDICKSMLLKSHQVEFLEILDKAKKKDDLADSYLQGIYYLSKKKSKV